MDILGDNGLSGLLSSIIPNTIPVKPNIINNELVIELTADELYDMLTKDLKPEQKQAISIMIRDNKLVIKVRLF